MSDIDIERYIQAVRDCAEEWASAKGQLVYLTHYRQSLLAKLFYSAPPSETSVGAREKWAQASDDYSDFLKGLKVAVEQEANAHWQLKRAEMKVELWRTKQATERLERKGYGA